MVLAPSFFERSTLKVAQELLGKFLVMQDRAGEKRALMVNEVEAYVGPHDLACHAARGKTPRTQVMFGPPGHFYVYFVYGMHWMLNIVTEKEGYPAAVLIRGTGELRGPARLTKFLGIDRRFNGLVATPKNGLWFEGRNVVFPKNSIQKTPRIGVSYAGPVWAAKPYRLVLSPSFAPQAQKDSDLEQRYRSGEVQQENRKKALAAPYS